VSVADSGYKDGGTYPSDLEFTATATSKAPITGWDIYMDGKLMYQNNSNSSTLNVEGCMPLGNHQVVLKAWNSKGGSGSQTLNLTLTAEGTP
jgi:hypothetical protein